DAVAGTISSTGHPSGASSAVANTSLGSATPSTPSRSGADSRGFTPAVTAPALALARYATKYSGHAGRASATTSPGPTPRATNPAATSSLTRSRSAYVTDHPSAATYAGVSANRRAAS